MTVQRVRIGAVDVDLGKQRKSDMKARGTELADGFAVARLLPAELVARKPEHAEPLVPVLPVQGFKAGVLRRKTAFTGGIDDQQHLAAVIGQ